MRNIPWYVPHICFQQQAEVLYPIRSAHSSSSYISNSFDASKLQFQYNETGVLSLLHEEICD